MKILKCESGSHGITVGQLRKWLADLPQDMLIAMSTDGEGNDFNVIVEADPKDRYNLDDDRRVHECDDECEKYRANLRELHGIPETSEVWLDCEYTWGGSETSDSDVHVVMLWPAG